MPVPTKPTAPAQALRSNPSTFSANAEASIQYQFGSFPTWIEDVALFCESEAAAAQAAAAAAGAGGGFDLTGKAGFYMRVKDDESATEFADPSVALLLRSGAVAMTGNLSMGNAGRVTNLVAGTSASDAVRKDQVKTEAFTAGMIMLWSGTIATVPSGWAICNGSNGTPDLRNRFVVGAGGDYQPGNTGGANTVTLTLGQIPSHIHGAGSLAAIPSGNHTHQLAGNGAGEGGPYMDYSQDVGSTFNYDIRGTNTPPSAFTSTTGGSHGHSMSGSTASAGSDQSHENRPPYYALAYIMKL